MLKLKAIEPPPRARARTHSHDEICNNQVGDVLFEVQGNNVYCTDPARIGAQLLGPEGTQASLPSALLVRPPSQSNAIPAQVELGFLRNISFPDKDNAFRVTLIRTSYPKV